MEKCPPLAEQSSMQHATWLTHCLGFRCIGREITRHKCIVIWQVLVSFSFDSYSDSICKWFTIQIQPQLPFYFEVCVNSARLSVLVTQGQAHADSPQLGLYKPLVQAVPHTQKISNFAIFKKYLQCVLAAKILTVYFVVYSCSGKKIRAGFDMSDRTIPL